MWTRGPIERAVVIVELFVISLPLMLVALGLTVVPLVAASRHELRHLARERGQRNDNECSSADSPSGHRRHNANASNVVASGADRTSGHARSWHEPLVLETRHLTARA